MSNDETPWWRGAVVYQIYPRSFCDSNGDGVGDLRGIIDRVPYIASLGVDAIWLSPIFLSPMADFGYDVAGYTEIDPLFGTVDDLDELIATLHDQGLRLLLDWVPNHTSDQHPWFVESRASRDNPKRDWYVWRDQQPDGSPPTNWTATFKGVPAWTHDAATDQSYLHLFLAEQPDLNWSNPEVEAAMHDTLRFWLDRGVDGFRADVVHLIGKGDDIEDLPDEQAALPIIAVDRPEGHERLGRIRALLDTYPQQPMIVGEVTLFEPGVAVSYLGTPGADELHLTFDFRPIYLRWDAAAFHDAIDVMQREFAEPHWPTWVLSNHDQRRHATRFGSDARSRAAAVLSLCMRGTPFLYAGEELGLADAEVPDDRVVDPAGRDGCRAPIPWATAGTTEEGHGWSARPWLPFPSNAATNAADAQEDDPDSILGLYRCVTALRRSRPVLRTGDMVVAPLLGSVLRFDRTSESDRLTVLVNFGTEAAAWPDDVVGDVVVRSGDAGPRVVAADEAILIDTALITPH